MKEIYKIASECIELGNLVIKNLDDLKLKFNVYDISEYRLILVQNFHKGLDSLSSMLLLCEKGYIGDADTIVRKILDIAVSMKYLSLDVENRIDLYTHYDALARYKILNEIEAEKSKNVGKEKVFSDYVVEEIEKEKNKIIRGYENVKKYYEPLNGNGEVHKKYLYKSWSGKSLPAMAKECGLTDYLIPYKLFNISTHTSIEDFEKYFDFDKCAFIELNKDDALPLIVTAISLCLVIAELIINEFELKFRKSLQSLAERLNGLTINLVNNRKNDSGGSEDPPSTDRGRLE
jgi:hypothetical protein